MKIKVKAGQIWKDNDPRTYDTMTGARLLRVESVDIRHAQCVVVRTGKATRISIDRMNGNKYGYSLYKDVKE